jgi:cytochrome P450
MTPDVDADFDHFGREFAADPAGAFRELREKCPVAHSSRRDGFWALTRWADVAEAARDDATFSSARYPADSGLPGRGWDPRTDLVRALRGRQARRPRPGASGRRAAASASES